MKGIRKLSRSMILNYVRQAGSRSAGEVGSRRRSGEIGSPAEIRSRDARISSLRDLNKFVKKFAKTLRGGEVIALIGPLGAGKTTFVQMLGRALGVRERITSPTFTLMHVHHTGTRKSSRTLISNNIKYAGSRSAGEVGSRIKFLVHIDAYRLGNPRALVEIGALDYLGRPDTVAVVEWAEKVRRVLPRVTRWINFSVAADGRRRLLLN